LGRLLETKSAAPLFKEVPDLGPMTLFPRRPDVDLAGVTHLRAADNRSARGTSPAASAISEAGGGPELGFTVIEFIVAISLLLIVLVPAARLMTTSILVSGNTRSRIVATYLASRSIEGIRGSANSSTTNSANFWSALPLGASTTTSVVNNITYSVTKNVEWVGQGVSGSNCSSGGTTPNILQVSASVTWPSMLGANPVQSTTDLAPPVGAFSTTAGAIASQVGDSDGNPVSNVTVTITGPSASSITTGADGCAFFGYTLPGTYTISASRAGYVSDQEQATPTYTNVTVAASQTTIQSFQMDAFATVTATPSASPAPAGGLTLSVDNNKLSPYGFVSYPAGVTSLSPLFPYNNGYTPFAGSCSDSDPLGKNASKVAFYPTASGAAVPAAALVAVNTDPGLTTAAGVQLYPLNLKVQVTILGVLTLPLGVGLTAVPTVAGTAISPSWTASYFNWVCPAPVASYTPAVTIAGGLSTTGIGLGHYTIVQTSHPTVALANVWVEPDGTHQITTSGGVPTVVAAPSTITITVSSLP
jgi:Tfp pilus assembly protein PilV